MDAVQEMQTQAAQCFRFACESPSEQDQRLFLGMRNAWLALAEQSRQIHQTREQKGSARQRTVGAVGTKRAVYKCGAASQDRRKASKTNGKRKRAA